MKVPVDDGAARRTVTVASEGEARRLVAELTLIAASARAAAVESSLFHASATEHNRALISEYSALECWRHAIRRESATQMHAATTQTQQANVAERYYGSLADTIGVVFKLGERK